jgi:hypothetical protein
MDYSAREAMLYSAMLRAEVSFEVTGGRYKSHRLTFI